MVDVEASTAAFKARVESQATPMSKAPISSTSAKTCNITYSPVTAEGKKHFCELFQNKFAELESNLPAPGVVLQPVPVPQIVPTEIVASLDTQQQSVEQAQREEAILTRLYKMDHVDLETAVTRAKQNPLLRKFATDMIHPDTNVDVFTSSFGSNPEKMIEDLCAFQVWLDSQPHQPHQPQTPMTALDTPSPAATPVPAQRQSQPALPTPPLQNTTVPAAQTLNPIDFKPVTREGMAAFWSVMKRKSTDDLSMLSPTSPATVPTPRPETTVLTPEAPAIAAAATVPTPQTSIAAPAAPTIAAPAAPTIAAPEAPTIAATTVPTPTIAAAAPTIAAPEASTPAIAATATVLTPTIAAAAPTIAAPEASTPAIAATATVPPPQTSIAAPAAPTIAAPEAPTPAIAAPEAPMAAPAAPTIAAPEAPTPEAEPTADDIKAARATYMRYYRSLRSSKAPPAVTKPLGLDV